MNLNSELLSEKVTGAYTLKVNFQSVQFIQTIQLHGMRRENLESPLNFSISL